MYVILYELFFVDGYDEDYIFFLSNLLILIEMYIEM